jgi:hypothetical protein
VHQRDFAGIARAAEHALAEERTAQRDTVEAANQLVVLVDLDAMGVTEAMKRDVELAYAFVDPTIRTAGARGGAPIDDLGKGRIDHDGVDV